MFFIDFVNIISGEISLGTKKRAVSSFYCENQKIGRLYG
jgi:hypothetical protein